MKRTQTENILFYLILFLASFIRLYKLDEIPLGLGQDEAYSGYEAFSLLTTGHDSWGYPFPMYLTTWGSGMSAIYAYLTIPFIALLGFSTFVTRLPHVFFSLLSCYVFYRLLRLIFPRSTALFGFFLSAIIPWQVLLAKSGLDANIAPFFILTGFYFFVKSFKNKDYLLLSAVFYGLGLYSYATTWIFVPISFGCQLIYLILYKHNQTYTLTILTSGLIFTILALPVILFILVNNNFISEIVTNYFSIPKLIHWRGEDINIHNLDSRLKNILSLILFGYDTLNQNTFPPYGIFYPISIPFIFIGIYLLCKKTKTDIKTSQFSISLCILLNLTIGFLYSLTFDVSIHRTNFLWFFFLVSIVTGLSPLITKKRWKKLIILIYLIFFICFSYAFLTKLNSMISDWFDPDFKPALEIAETTHKKTGLPIKILETRWIHPRVLFYTKTPTNDYISTVKWQKNFLTPVASFTHFYFNPHIDYEHPEPDAIYIAPAERLPFFHKFNTRVVGSQLVAIPKQTN